MAAGDRDRSRRRWSRGIVPGARLVLYLTGLHAVPRRLGRGRGCVVWMYHSVSQTLAAHRYPYAVTPRRFEAHLRFLRRRGIPILPISEVAERVRAGRPFDRLSAAITFDDGWRDNVLEAYPILQKYSAPAALFVTADWIGRETFPVAHLSDIRIPGRAMMDWEELRRLAAGGLVTIGAHGVSHRPLTSISAGEARNEILDSKRRLEDGLGKPVTFFSYPAGMFDRPAVDLVREAGYAAAFTSLPREVRPGSDPFALGRFDAARHASRRIRILAALLNRAYFATGLSLGR